MGTKEYCDEKNARKTSREKANSYNEKYSKKEDNNGKRKMEERDFEVMKDKKMKDITEGECNSICPLCSSKEALFMKKAMLGEKSSNYLKCKLCGLVYVYPQFVDIDIQQYYETQEYFEHARGYNLKNLKKQFYEECRGGVQRLIILKKILNYTVKNKKILDIGCATGGFLYESKKKGAICYGIEPFKNYGSFAKKKLGNIYLNIFEEVDFNQKFDLITSFGVFHHFRNPNNVLKKFYELLNDDGRLLIGSVPNLDAHEFDIGGEAQYMPFFYSSSTLQKLVSKNNFKIEAMFSMGATRTIEKSSKTERQKNVFKDLVRNILKYPYISYLLSKFCYSLYQDRGISSINRDTLDGETMYLFCSKR